MDKTLLKAYIRTIVEEEVKKILPEMLAEAVAEVKKINKINESSVPTTTPSKPKVDRKRLAELMGIEYDRESATIRATTEGLSNGTLSAVDAAGNRIQVPEASVDPAVRAALTRDYSAVLKAMKVV